MNRRLGRRGVLQGMAGIALLSGLPLARGADAETLRPGVEALALAIASGSRTALAAVDAVIERAAAWQDLNVFTTLDVDRARQAARFADAEYSLRRRLGPLHGVPIAVKDTIDTTDLPTSYGHRALIGFRPLYDAGVVQRLEAAGALIVAKTNCDEFNFGSFNTDSAFGRTLNPYDARRITGGSSGGSAAVVAAGIVPAALGADTTGSVRMPAGLCGCCGFRPTTGRYPTSGVWPLLPGMDTPGTFARAVADLALLDAVLAPTGKPSQRVERALTDLRLGVPRRYFYELLDGASGAVIERALTTLRDAGATLVEVDLGDLEPLVAAAAYPRLFATAEATFRKFIAERQIPLSLSALVDGMTPAVRTLWREVVLDGAPGHPGASELRAAQSAASELERRHRRAFASERLDALLLPVTPYPAPVAGEEGVELDGRTVSVFDTIERCTAPGSIVGAPGLVIPAGLTTAGLPVGLQLEGRPGGDRALLAVGRAVEALLFPYGAVSPSH